MAQGFQEWRVVSMCSRPSLDLARAVIAMREWLEASTENCPQTASCQRALLVCSIASRRSNGSGSGCRRRRCSRWRRLGVDGVLAWRRRVGPLARSSLCRSVPLGFRLPPAAAACCAAART
eukprot:2591209-Pyramimonas_sp.AAC.1